MRKLLLLILIVTVMYSCRSWSERAGQYYVEDYRGIGKSDDEVIQDAINEAGEGATIHFATNETYLITNRILVKKNQNLNGNNATLKRADQTFTTLASPADFTVNTIRVKSVPGGWKRGDQLQIFLDSSTGSSNSFGDYRVLPNIITRINGKEITLSSPVGRDLSGRLKQWPAEAKVRKVYSILRGDSIEFRSAPFSVTNMNFDGNRDKNNLNFYWNINSTIFMRGMGGRVEHCTFRNIPNETIVGQGMLVFNCYASGLNGSFVHLSGNDSMPDLLHRNAMILGNTVIGVCQVSTYATGHSEGVITTSYNGGFATVSNNRFYNSGESAIGTIDGHLSVDDGGKSEFIIVGNLFKNCKRVIHSVVYGPEGSTLPTDIFISNNVFSKCGKNDWSKITGKNNYSGMKVGPNAYTNGTTWYMPESELK
jgi:hypothetical protein